MSSIADAFKKLNVTPNGESTDHEKVFSISYDYLTKVKNFNDVRAFKNCLVALIYLDRYEKALEIVTKIPKDDEDIINELVLEISYIYYKVGKGRELLKLVEKVGQVKAHDLKTLSHSAHLDLLSDSISNLNRLSSGVKIGLKHILAQNFYKLGEYSNSLNLYYDLIENNKYDNKTDLVINERAIISQLNFQHHKNIASKFDVDLENYDLLFNEALIQLSKKQINDAEKLLHQAEAVCLNSGFSEADLETELLPIRLTLAYIYDLQGDQEKSLDLLRKQDITVDDAMLKLIIKNNLYSLDKESVNYNLMERDLDYQHNLQILSQKLTKLQFEVIFKNSVMLRYATGSLSSKTTRGYSDLRFLEDFPNDKLLEAYRILLKLDITYKQLNDELECKQLARKVFKHFSTNLNKVGALLLVFLNDRSKNFSQSMIILEKMCEQALTNEEKLSPAVFGTLIKVYEKQHLVNQLESLLHKITDKLTATEVTVFQQDLNYYNFAKIIGFKWLNSGNKEAANTVFDKLLQANEHDTLLSALVNHTTDGLVPVESLTSSDPIEELLNTPIDTLVHTTTKPVIKPQSKPGKIVKRKRTPKFSASKVMKPVEDLQLDEERWLPMKMRSYYKPSKKDKKRSGGGHQGAVEPVTSSTPSVSTSSKKKKKKGKK